MDAEILHKLEKIGQSIWLDNINAALLSSGKLKKLADMGLRGLTSNPTIFEKAITSGSAYDEKIKKLASEGKSPFEIYDELTVSDVKEALKIFLPLYEASNGQDGYVSLEVNPELASDTKRTLDEAVRLHKKVGMPNLMLKIPATEEGYPAIEELIGMGMNVNVTLIFSLGQYLKTSQAYINGLKKLAASGRRLSAVASVASVFVSRIDGVCDKALDEKISAEKDRNRLDVLRALKATAAVANSKRIYSHYMAILDNKDFAGLAKKGARPQRVLWASTSTKDPVLSDIKYITELIGNGTVNTVPDSTLQAFIDHGEAQVILTGNDDSADKILSALKSEGIDVDAVCRKLLADGLDAFKRSFASLIGSLEEKSRDLTAAGK